MQFSIATLVMALGASALTTSDSTTTQTSTQTMTRTITLTSCGPEVTNCPARNHTTSTSVHTTSVHTTSSSTSSSSSSRVSSYFPLTNTTTPTYFPTVASTGFISKPASLTVSSYLPIKTASSASAVETAVGSTPAAAVPVPAATSSKTTAASATPSHVTAGAGSVALKGGVLAGSLALAMLVL